MGEIFHETLSNGWGSNLCMHFVTLLLSLCLRWGSFIISLSVHYNYDDDYQCIIIISASDRFSKKYWDLFHWTWPHFAMRWPSGESFANLKIFGIGYLEDTYLEENIWKIFAMQWPSGKSFANLKIFADEVNWWKSPHVFTNMYKYLWEIQHSYWCALDIIAVSLFTICE